jgi:hypothetical protein
MHRGLLVTEGEEHVMATWQSPLIGALVIVVAVVIVVAIEARSWNRTGSRRYVQISGRDRFGQFFGDATKT